MKVKVGMTGDEIEIGQYREVNKGALKAFFSLIIYSPEPYTKQDKILDCRYFCQGESCWFSFPQKEVRKPGVEKPDYIPLRSYGDKKYLEQLKIAILTALREQESNGQSNSYQKQAAPLQDDASSVWFG